MKGTYTAVAIMTVIVLAALGYGFFSAGAPWAIRGYKLDATRMSDFSSIQEIVQESYSANQYQLPATLAAVESSTYASYYVSQGIFKDPGTGQPYDYKIVSSTSYQLCATFAASSAEENQANGTTYDGYLSGELGSPTQHTQGYDCLSYNVPAAPSVPVAYPDTYYPSGVPTASSTYNY